jgi:hypothetical protein
MFHPEANHRSAFLIHWSTPDIMFVFVLFFFSSQAKPLFGVPRYSGQRHTVIERKG